MKKLKNLQTYKIITDEKKLREFIDWLPDLEDNEIFYLSLFARKKYSETNLIKTNDKTQLKRFVSTKEFLYTKIQALERPLGKWTLKGTVAPQDSLVLYIHVIPRDMGRATRCIGKKAWDLIYNKNYNLIAESMSCIQTSKSKLKLIEFDIDDEDKDFKIEELDKILTSYNIVETRGDFHLLIPTNVEHKEYKWYLMVQELYKGKLDKDAGKGGDMMLPIPGTIQGGFTPKLILNE